MNGDHGGISSGTLIFLAGLILLVFAGIFFSLAIDKRFRFSSGRAALERSIAAQQRELESLEKKLATARGRWERNYQPLQGQDLKLESARESAAAAAARLQHLTAARLAAEESLQDEQLAFQDYRERYRRQVRLDAVGERLDELRVRSGKVYRAVTIRRVTPAGLEIGHAEGNSRVRPDDLEPSWGERFQWSPDETAAFLAKEAAAAIPAARQDRSSEKSAPASEGPDVVALNAAMAQALARMERAQHEADRARSEASTNRGKSVPGSLETWDERAQRMEAAAAQYRAHYLQARARLHAARANRQR
jgi:hypothetical protein